MAVVLIVDDGKASRDILTDLLTSAGHRAIAAKSAAEAERVVEQQLPDVVLVDTFMPGRDGIELIISLHRKHPQLPLVALGSSPSGQPGFDLAEDALALGAKRVLRKPIATAELLELVRRFEP